MFSWNTCTWLWNPEMSFGRMKLVMRATIAALGVGAVWMALEVQSVQALWFFTSDLVFVLLFPQLISALFDSEWMPFKTVAAGAGLVLLPLVSRLTASLAPPRPLRNLGSVA